MTDDKPSILDEMVITCAADLQPLVDMDPDHLEFQDSDHGGLTATLHFDDQDDLDRLLHLLAPLSRDWASEWPPKRWSLEAQDLIETSQ